MSLWDNPLASVLITFSYFCIPDAFLEPYCQRRDCFTQGGLIPRDSKQLTPGVCLSFANQLIQSSHFPNWFLHSCQSIFPCPAHPQGQYQTAGSAPVPSVCCSSHQPIPDGSVGRESTCNAQEMQVRSWVGRVLREGNGSPLQHPCWEVPAWPRGAWRASTVCGVTQGWT